MRSPFPFALTLAVAAAGLSAQPQLLIPLGGSEPAGCAPQMRPQRPLSPAEQAAAAFQRPQLRGRKLATAVNKVRKKLEWHRSLEAAARAAAEAGKPIVWIQALGDLHGYT